MREIRALAASGHGVLFTTHDPNHALRAADRAYLLRDGECLAEGASQISSIASNSKRFTAHP
jgi:iron complex transport system ATP-binding protein